MNDNYFTGWNVVGDGDEHRSFFTFDLTTFSTPVYGATLRLTLFGNHDIGNITIGFFDVSTPAATLVNGTASIGSTWNDLGSGTSYGSITFPGTGTYQPETILTISLNSFAVAAINDANGGFFSIGGAWQSPASVGSSEFAVFGGSGIAGGVQRLVIYTSPDDNFLVDPFVTPDPWPQPPPPVTEVPEPDTYATLLAGLGLLGFVGRRRKRKVA